MLQSWNKINPRIFSKYKFKIWRIEKTKPNILVLFRLINKQLPAKFKQMYSSLPLWHLGQSYLKRILPSNYKSWKLIQFSNRLLIQKWQIFSQVLSNRSMIYNNSWPKIMKMFGKLSMKIYQDKLVKVKMYQINKNYQGMSNLYNNRIIYYNKIINRSNRQRKTIKILDRVLTMLFLNLNN